MAAQQFVSRDDVAQYYRDRVNQALNVDADFDFDSEPDDPATLLLDRSISAANEQIQSYLIDRYALPLSSVPDNIKEIGATIVFYMIVRTRPDVAIDADLEAHKTVMANLKSLARGDTFLENPRRNVTAATEQRVAGFSMGGSTPLRDLLDEF
jgi:phage gp36-like protein